MGIVSAVVVAGYTVHNGTLIEEGKVVIGVLWYVWKQVKTTPYFFHIRKILIEICVEKDQSGLQRGSHLWPKRGFT